MAMSSITAVLFLCCSVFAVSEERILRREAPQVKEDILVALSAQGELREVNKHGEGPADEFDTEEQPCNVDFTLGVEGSAGCVEGPGNHTAIKSPAMCIFAANFTGAHSDHTTFMVANRADQEKHPKGCFKHTCAAGVAGTCYYYNDIPVEPGPNVVGTPICRRLLYVNGTKDSADADGGCPAKYKVIEAHNATADQTIDERTCQAAGFCLGNKDAPEFRVGVKNASEHLLHPLGCLFDDVLDEVYFNPRSAMGAGETVQGTPICEPIDRLHWAADTPVATAAATPAATPAANASST